MIGASKRRSFEVSSPKIAVVIPAAGQGRRAGRKTNKLLAELGGVTVIETVARGFQEHARIDRIVLAVAAGDHDDFERRFGDGRIWDKLAPWAAGGKDRQESVRNGLAVLASDPPDWVLVHDGARPFCTDRLVNRVLEGLVDHNAVVPVLSLPDTVRQNGPDGREVLDREQLVRCQTPQGFQWTDLWKAHAQAEQKGFVGTDDAQLIQEMAGAIHFVPGEPRNVKLTLPEDFLLGEWLLSHPGWGT